MLRIGEPGKKGGRMDVSRVSKSAFAVNGSNASVGSQQPPKTSFAQTLDNAINVGDGSCASKASSHAAPVTFGAFVQPVASSLETRPELAKTVEYLGTALNLLDEYAQGLRSSKHSLRDLEPIVDKMEQAVNLLGQAKAGGGLARLVNDISVTAAVESFKFRRGDYVS